MRQSLARYLAQECWGAYVWPSSIFYIILQSEFTGEPPDRSSDALYIPDTMQRRGMKWYHRCPMALTP